MTNEEKLAEEYKNYRKQCGYENPVALDEIEGAYYMGMLKQKDLIIKKACEWLKENADSYIYEDFKEIKLDMDDLTETFKKAMEE